MSTVPEFRPAWGAARRSRGWGRALAGAFFAVLACLASVCSQAGSAPGVTIAKIEADDNGLFFVYLSANISNVAVCGQSQPNAFAVDSSTAGGKIMVTVIAEAYALGKSVEAVGSGVCSVYATYESLHYVITQD